VVTPEGLPIAYEVFAGNTADVTTVEDMVAMVEAKYDVARRRVKGLQPHAASGSWTAE